jgi:hypothetical protein
MSILLQNSSDACVVGICVDGEGLGEIRQFEHWGFHQSLLKQLECDGSVMGPDKWGIFIEKVE